MGVEKAEAAVGHTLRSNSIYSCLRNACCLSGTMLALSHTIPNSYNNYWGGYNN